MFPLKRSLLSHMPLQAKQHLGLLAVTIFSLMSLLFAACGTNGSSGQPNIVLKMIFDSNPSTNTTITKLNQAFHQQNPNITVQTTIVYGSNYDQLLSTRLAANDVDIMGVGPVVPVPQPWMSNTTSSITVQAAQQGQLLDLTGQPFLKNYYPSVIQKDGTYSGKVYSVAAFLDVYSGIFYNEDIFAKYHIALPKTFNQFVAACDTLKAHGVAPITTGGKELWPLDLLTQSAVDNAFPDLQQQSEALWKGRSKFTDPTYVNLITRSQKVMSYLEPNFQGLDVASSVGHFSNGLSAMLIDGTWDQADIRTANPSIHYGYFPLPFSDTAADNQTLSGKYDLHWAIAAHSAHSAAALKWLAFFSDPKQYQSFTQSTGNIPTQNVPASALDPFVKSLQPYLSNIKLSWDQVELDPKDVGKYAGADEFHLEFLAPSGPIQNPQQLASKTQQDWQAAISAK